MEKWILFGAGFGIVVCMFIFREGSPEFTCQEGNTQIQFCVHEEEADYTSIENVDETMNQYFRDSHRDGDSIGFSLDKTLVLNLSAYLSLNPESYGVRLFPGQSGSSKFVLIKPLDGEGNERPDLGAIMDVTNIGTGLGGPCPDWCARPGRLIFSNITPPASTEE